MLLVFNVYFCSTVFAKHNGIAFLDGKRSAITFVAEFTGPYRDDLACDRLLLRTLR